MTLETILPFLEGMLAGRNKVWESGLVFCGTGSWSFAGELPVLAFVPSDEWGLCSRSWRIPLGGPREGLQHQSLPSVVGAAVWGEFAVAGVANSRCVCMPTGCFAELYFSPVVGLSLMVDLNLAYLLKGERSYKLPLSWFLFWLVGFFGFLLMIQNVRLDQYFSCRVCFFFFFYFS